MVRRWPALATGGSDFYGINWNRRLPSGSSLMAVDYTSDPAGLTFSNNAVSDGVSTVEITAPNDNSIDGKKEYRIKCVPTLDSQAISPVSVLLTVTKHKPAE